MTVKKMTVSKEVALYGIYRLSKACRGTVTGFQNFVWSITNGNQFIHTVIETNNYIFLETKYPSVGFQENLTLKLDCFGCVERGYYHRHHHLPDSKPEWETLTF